ncbi:MAG: Oxidoreductase [uncultured Frankineae bacterium]|uniref:Oxidoreductase n=1 Tax=uncultured Frankineae bacterium TaxID=437475 RepID=A0A6J4M8Q6_9ACTN|nr:MAG: Oxidoreductase [uncultured Frankineae bacterium]
MQQRPLGHRTVGAVGLGAMPLSIEGRPDEAQAVRTVHAALDAGVTLLDTADAYCQGADEVGHNERLLARALASWSGDRDAVVVATKGGHTRPPDGSWALDGSREHLRAACEASLRALGVESIGLYQFHRPDPQVPWAESVGALEELRTEGKIQLVGVSNADPAQIREAQGLTQLASVQNELSPRFRSSEPEVDLCAEQGIAFLPWSPLGGIAKAGELGRAHGAFAEVASERGVSPQQVCLAWLLAKAPVVIPIPGARRVESILDSVAAAELRLSDDEIARLDQS